MARKYKRRRGIVILVVLSLLVLFVLLAVTFAIVAGQYQRAARAHREQQLLGVDPPKDLDKAFYQLLRDEPIPGSAVRFHPLLRDMYGEDGFTGALVAGNWLNIFNRVQNPPSNPNNYPLTFDVSGGQCMGLVVNAIAGSTDGLSFTFSRVPSYYSGCVLTFTSGRANGLSTRIIGSYYWLNGNDPSDPFNNRGILRIMTPARDDGKPLTPSDLAGASFVVNGRPFSGTGFGYNSGATGSAPKLNRSVPFTDRNGTAHPLPIALLPNYAAWDNNTIIPLLLQGGSDEGYDAPDFQNLAMAIIQTRPNGAIDRMPSFHRPALVQYWRNTESTLWQEDVANDFKRQFILRPIEPNFDGSNPDYYALPIDTSVNPPVVMPGVSWYETGPWDVDNDGDGVRDSIWIDLGLPVQTAHDGRKYRPLFAILCRDLDGLLNLNAHGRLAQYVPTNHLNDGGDPQRRLYRKGLGYGPPEIDLFWTGITGDPAVPANLAKLRSLLTSRYGADRVPGRPGLDPLARLRFFEEPSNYFVGPAGRTSYSSPPDLRAELAFGVNMPGQPIFEPLPVPPAVPSVTEARADSAYELNLLDGSVGDDPYTPAEYERLARRFDYDRNLLPNRLVGITKPMLVTTNSFDVPMPSISAPRELVNYINSTLSNPTGHLSAHNAMDLLIARMQANRDRQSLPRFGVGTLSRQLVKMLSVDLAMGLRFDLNRPFGNAQDGSVYSGNGDAALQGVGIVDEPALPPINKELQNERLYFGNNAIGRAEFNNAWMWHNNGFLEPDKDNNDFLDDLDGDGEGNGDPTNPVDADDAILSRLLARQRYARQLYVLMLTLMDHGTTGGIPNAPNPNEARKVAQWAINVVDFRDADSIMTPFEFDPNPFDGWNVDGVVNGYFGMASVDDNPARIVWGCERPELLLMEAFAYHDRRTKDTAAENNGKMYDPDPTKEDDDWDQLYVPFATAFIELYNPWTGSAALTPGQEFYGGSGGVQLNRTTPSGNPVWRILVVDLNDYPGQGPGIATNSLDPDAPGAAVSADRAVYFVNSVPALPAGAAHGRRRYFTDLLVPPIQPGQYAVVGGGFPVSDPSAPDTTGLDPAVPANQLAGAYWVSPVGNTNDGTAPRRIVLKPNGPLQNPPVAPVTVFGNGGTTPTSVVPNAVAIVPNRSDVTVNPVVNNKVVTAFSVSEPRTGYRREGASAPDPETFDPGTRKYVNVAAGTDFPFDTPFDSAAGFFTNQVVDKNGTTRPFCRVYLQRLANPLQDYHPVANPYRTIDSMPMDLTAFNGLESYDDGSDPELNNIDDVDFSSLQRGDADGAGQQRQLWRQEPVSTNPMLPPMPANNHYFPYPFARLTLGRQNTNHNLITHTFPWLVFNNRPFVSSYELMQVPRNDCWNLLKTFRLPVGASPYDNSGQEYPHLLNFFHTTGGGSTPPHYYRIFDYVTVPSRFVGTDTVLNPDFFGKTTNFPQPNLASLGFLPPFNRISKYRVPGLVNINTVPHWTVWNAIRGPHVQVTRDPTTPPPNPPSWINPQPDYTKTGPDYSVVFSSREANGGSPTVPTMFANPYRPMGARDLVPVASLRPSQDIDVTLMRGSTGTPQMEISPANDPDLPRHTRNSFFRYELLHRLGNMVTTRSNVYAIWITVGYFEMEPNYNPVSGQVVFDRYHPEGLRVGQEIGIDTGEIRRHRAFYMIDRTIPVAFEPGQNHNVDKCVLLRRYIE